MTRDRAVQPSTDHRLHDRLLIVRAASGDLYAGEEAQAHAQLERCSACASLAADLGHVSAALRTLPTPRRTRDFRITPERAEALRGTPFERFLRRFAGPRFGVLQPLAGAVMSIGLVLVVAGATLPAGGPSATEGGADGPRQGFAESSAAPMHLPGSAEGAPGGAPPSAESAAGYQDGVPRDATATPGAAAEGFGEPHGEASGGAARETQAPAAAPEATSAAESEAPEAAPQATTAAESDAIDAGGRDEEGAVGPTGSAPSSGAGTLLLSLGAVLIVLGVAVLTVRIAARRATADPLLR